MYEARDPSALNSVAGAEQPDRAGVSENSAAEERPLEPSAARPKLEQYLIQQVQTEVSERSNQSLYAQLTGQRYDPVSSPTSNPAPNTSRPGSYRVTRLQDPDESDWREECSELSPTIQTIVEHPDTQGPLLILGEPGCGKTTALLDLAAALLAKTERPSAPIPVLFDLSTWGNWRQSIPSWLEGELMAKYNVTPNAARQWVRQQTIVPLLDRLGGVERAFRAACVQALNRWMDQLQSAGRCYPVICCRTAAYDELSTPLNASTVVTITKLSDLQIASVLNAVGRSHLTYHLQRNPTLNELVRAPAFLCMLAIVDRTSAHSIKRLLATQRPATYLIQMYVQGSLNRMWRYSPSQAHCWLVWVARQMQMTSQAEFEVDALQPVTSLRHSLLLWQYHLGLGLAFGLIGGVFGGLLGGEPGAFFAGAIFALIGLGGEIVPRLTSQSPASRWRRSRRFGWRQLAIASLLYIPVVLLSVTFAVSLGIGPIYGFALVGLGIVLFGLSGWLVGDLGGRLTESVFRDGGWIQGGLGDEIKRGLLRLILWWSGRSPWNYQRFLDECTSVQLLQKTGDRYRFIHTTVQEYFTPSDY